MTTKVAGENERKTVSVALATYNGARFLRPLLDSIAVQTRLPDELVVTDDSSSDETIRILEEFSGGAPFRVLIHRHPTNVGVLENFKAAFSRTTGEIIFYCDQDDIWLPEKIARITTLFERGDPVHLAAHRSMICDEFLNPKGMLPEGGAVGRVAFPVDASLLQAHGHQIAFTRETAGIVASLHPHTRTLAPELHNNLDTFLPFCASLLGDIWLSDEALVKFRRHQGTVSPLAKPSRSTTSERVDRLQALARKAIPEARDYADRYALFRLAAERQLVDPALTPGLDLAFGARSGQATELAAAVSAGFVRRLGAVIRYATSVLLRPGGFTNARRIRQLAIAVAVLRG